MPRTVAREAGGELLRIERGSDRYPARLVEYLGATAPAVLTAAGNVAALERRSLALFCSIACPGRLILQTYDLVRALREAGVTVISGFHSPMEKETLPFLLRGKQPVIVCPARRITTRGLPEAQRTAMKEGRLLLLSPFKESQSWPNEKMAWHRNALVAALADEVLVIHANAGSRMVAFAQEVLRWGKPVLTLAGEENAALLEVGVEAVTVERWSKGELRLPQVRS